jgi:eukaryotic-like serine/threonine-protein kinase
MPLVAGTRLGPYEIVSSLGAGGMGEVYRARDPRLGRDVAIKVIGGEGPPAPERLRRFEQEARSVAALQHPHILAVHDLGTHEGRPYLVLELLEGETLRERLSHGPFPVRKAVEVAVQICDGLAAAHAHGVVHRDLKPENVFLVREGGVKLLDFGLAKLLEASEEGGSEAATETATDRGMWVGTAGYVSPEQLRGQSATARSDVFALGAVLFEMLTGQRAFRGATKADTLAAILEKDPPAITLSGGAVPAPLERVVLRCLEKDPNDRFQSARDVALALEALSTGSASESAAALGPAKPSRRWWWLAAGLLGAAGIASLGFVAGRRAADKPAPTFKQLTFRRGWLDQARFAPDGRTVIYGAGWDGKPVELFQTRTDSPESRPLGLTHARVLSISSQGEMAILLDPARQQGVFSLGTLAVVPLAGGTPRELLENVYSADWTPDGRNLCVSRLHPNGEITIELPPGTVLHRTRERADLLRMSRDGRLIVFRDVNARKVVLLDRERKVAKVLGDLGANFFGLAWSPTDREVWYTEGASRGARDVYAVDLEGRRRLVYRSPSVLSLVDTAPDGRVLFHRALDRYGAMALLPGSQVEQDVTVYDDSVIWALSPDGRMLLLNTLSDASGPPSAYLRRDGGDPMRVAAGRGLDISPDGRSALVVANTGGLSVVPIGPGLPRQIDLGALRASGGAWLPSPHEGIIVRGHERQNEPYSLWLIDERGSKPRRLAVGAFPDWAIAPDGRQVAARTAVDTVTVIPLAGGPSRDIRALDVHLSVRRWSGDGRSIYLGRTGGWPCEIHRLDLATEKIELWKQVAPPDPTGILQCTDILPSADGRSYAYGTNRSLASLIVAEGLR